MPGDRTGQHRGVLRAPTYAVPMTRIQAARPRDGAPRLRPVVAVAAGVVVAAVVATSGGARYSPLAGWVALAVVFTGWTWLAVGRMDAESTRTHATREVPGRTVTHLLLIAVAVASLVGVGALLLSDAGRSSRVADAVVAFLAVVASWFTLHTLYALRYARLYYGGTPGGIDFHQDEPPRYTDFAYVAITVGMSFAISDTDVGSTAVRRTALGHALLSYLFGSVILAVLINLVAGL